MPAKSFWAKRLPREAGASGGMDAGAPHPKHPTPTVLTIVLRPCGDGKWRCQWKGLRLWRRPDLQVHSAENEQRTLDLMCAALRAE